MRKNYVLRGKYFMCILKKTSFALKLFFSYLALVIIPFFISTLILSSTSSSNIENNTLSYIHLFVEQISSNIDSYIGELDRMTRITTLDANLCSLLTEPVSSQKVELYHQTKYLENEMLKMMTQQPSIRNIAFVGTNGVIYSGPSNSVRDESLFFETTRSDFTDHTQPNLYLSSAHVPSYLLVDYQQNAEPVFTLTRFLYTDDRRPIGSVVLTIACRDLMDAISINPSLLESGARIIITNKENEIVADTSPAFIPENLKDSSYLRFSVSDSNLEDELCFSDSSGSLNSAVIINRNQLFKSTLDFNRSAIFLVVLLIGVIILLSASFSRMLVRPLKLLEDAANECASGNYSIRIPVTSEDEIGSLCASFNFMTEQIQNLLDRVYHYQLATKQAQLEALQNQINPHFLHNTLEIIRMKALINQDREVAGMVQTLAKLFRITLDRTSNIVKIKDELEHVETYLTIQNMRFADRFKFTNLVPDELLDCSILKLTLQPLVENAIKHGFSRTFGNEEIQICAEENDNKLTIRVIDNGTGIAPEHLEQIRQKLAHRDTPERKDSRNSIGIINISDRIQLEYGAEYSLQIYRNSPHGTIVELCIPKNYSPEILPELV